MNYPATLEKNHARPITIARLEAVFRMPLAWFDAVTSARLDMEHMLSVLVCEGHAFMPPHPPNPRFVKGWPRMWEAFIQGPDAGEMVKVSLVAKASLFDCVEALAREVKTSPNELILAVLARQIPLYLETAEPLRNARASLPPTPGKVIPGPWKLSRQRG